MLHGAELELSDARTTGAELELSCARATGRAGRGDRGCRPGSPRAELELSDAPSGRAGIVRAFPVPYRFNFAGGWMPYRAASRRACSIPSSICWREERSLRRLKTLRFASANISKAFRACSGKLCKDCT